MKKVELKDKNVLVLGLGDTGLSALRWLKGQSARLSVADTRVTPPNLAAIQAEFQHVELYLGEYQESTFVQAEVLVLSPGVSVKTPMVQASIARGIPVVGDVELFAQFKPTQSKVIAITGSNGKTTVTSLVGEICKAARLNTIVAGNIGLPVLDTLAMPAPDVYVLELSSFQLETTRSLNADVATMLNLSEDHLDRHDDMADYALAKRAVFNGNGIQVLNRDDYYSMQMAQPNRDMVTFGLDLANTSQDYGVHVIDKQVWLMQGNTQLLKMADTKLTGLHNAANVLAAIALCRAIDIPMSEILKAVSQFKGLPHRVEWVAQINQVDFYDDSKGTNVGATCAAIAGMQQKVVLIAGGDGKGQDFSPLKPPIEQNARAVVLIGRDAPLIEQALLPSDVPMYRAIDLPEAVAIALKVAKKGDAVLLSPACASFDMFKNYVHRAEVFVEAVNHLAIRSQQNSPYQTGLQA